MACRFDSLPLMWYTVRMNKKYDFTCTEIEHAAQESQSRSAMMRMLGIRQGGGGYQALEYWCRKYGVTPPDGRNIGNANLVGHSFVAMPDEEWFVNGVRRTGPGTRARLVARGVPDVCSVKDCGQPPVWLGKPLTLQIDHVNGDRWDNRIENVRILCPHCHTQTETYANTGRRKARHYCDCGKEICKTSKTCALCQNQSKSENIDWPSLKDVVEQVRLTNFSKYAKVLGVSDNAVRKFLRRNDIDPKTLKPVVV